ncbi:MAG TPA: hypothetical protein VJ761_25060, partial [Ktedonobacteraceae bacterium]|nr:hypothetical protein [Ktedonobacteraceae bacterium]
MPITSSTRNSPSPLLSHAPQNNFNQKSLGTYYTCPEITAYLSKRTIHSCILHKINAAIIANDGRDRHFSSLEALLANLDAHLYHELLAILSTISILDPACGDGAFLVAALETLTGIYESITSIIASINDPSPAHWLEQARAEHGNLTYFLKKKIISENLFGVD